MSQFKNKFKTVALTKKIMVAFVLGSQGNHSYWFLATKRDAKRYCESLKTWVQWYKVKEEAYWFSLQSWLKTKWFSPILPIKKLLSRTRLRNDEEQWWRGQRSYLELNKSLFKLGMADEIFKEIIQKLIPRYQKCIEL